METGNLITVKVRMTGMDELGKAIAAAEEKLLELRAIENSINRAVQNIGCEIVQPSAETDG